MATTVQLLVVGCLVASALLEFAQAADLTCATDKQRLDINQLIQKWNEDSVVLNDKISTYETYKGTHTKQTYRLDNERPTADGFAKFRIQSDSVTYGDVLIKPNKNFGKTKIRNIFIQSVRDCKITKLE